MHAIVFKQPREIIYRPHGEHDHCTGVGRVEQVMDAPYCRPTPPRGCTVENLCGRFSSAFARGFHEGVTLTGQGALGRGRREMFHLDGSVFLCRHCACFKGAKGAIGLARLARDLRLESPAARVHMAVFSLSVSRYLQTTQGCYLENRLTERFCSLRVCTRLMDMNMLIKLRVNRFDPREMPLDADLAPTSMDLMVSKKGVVLVRMSWPGLKWTEEVERRLGSFCDWIGERVRECS